MRIDNVFATKIYAAEVAGEGSRRLLAGLRAACLSIAEDDTAGQAWCAENGYAGYTSYASLDDLPARFPEFADLERVLDAHVAAFARELDLDLGRRPLALDSLWINVLASGGAHSGHIHPNCVISGTYYVEVPEGSGAIRFEDPRLAMMMAAPPRRQRASRENRSFVHMPPRPGLLLLWESYLRHEVMPSRARTHRVSVSFNYRWGK